MRQFETLNDMDQMAAAMVVLDHAARRPGESLSQAATVAGKGDQELWSEWMLEAGLPDCTVPLWLSA